MSFLKPVSSQGIIQLLSGYKNLDCHLYNVVFSGVAQFWSPLMSLLDEMGNGKLTLDCHESSEKKDVCQLIAQKRVC